MCGTLYVVSTPIGNLGDISTRAVDVLSKVSLIACEDTRVTGKLLARYRIETPTVSYHEHNERRRAHQLIMRLVEGRDIALTSDAGTPGVSDPGYRLVSQARKQGIAVYTIPGPSAVLAALSISGLPTSSFCFLGFLPARAAARRKAIDSLSSSPHTVVLFESARRIRPLLTALAQALGPRPAFLAREMTKVHEEHLCGTLPELARWTNDKSLRGELTLVISGKQEPGGICRASWDRFASTIDPSELRCRFQSLIGSGLSRRQAAKQLAHEYGVSSRAVYQEMLELESTDRRDH